MIGHTDEVTQSGAQLALRRLTIRGIVFVCKQPLRPTQPPTLSMTGNDGQLGGSAMWMLCSVAALVMCQSLWYIHL